MTIAESNDGPSRIAILGVGLLGGSVAKSIRRARADVEIVGWARDATKCADLEKQGIVDAAKTSVSQACQDCDVVVVATPVDRIAELVIQAAETTSPDCLITDVGSTKGSIVAEVGRHPEAASRFVPAHPIAGSEKSGAVFARADLFDGKPIILTPHAAIGSSCLEKAKNFWRLTGGNLVVMSPDQHDTHLAAISHVPHLVSALVARMADDEARPLVGSGWRDITRVAAGDPTMWTAICRENRPAIAGQLDRFARELDTLAKIIRQADDQALWDWLAEAQRIKQQDSKQQD